MKSWAEVGAFLVEGHDHGAVEPHPGEKAQLGGFIGETELWSGRAEKAPRMRLEGHCQRRPAMHPPHLQRRGDDGTVTEMDAVEIAHRDHASLRDRGRGRRVADDAESGFHFSDYSKNSRQDSAAKNLMPGSKTRGLDLLLRPDRGLARARKSSRSTGPTYRCKWRYF